MQPKPFTERLRRGAIGERIIRARLRALDYVLYSPDPDQIHLVDGYAYRDGDGRMFAFEVKTYPARTKYADTGLNAYHWKKYTDLAERLPVVVFWVDPHAGTIYCGKVDDLRQHARPAGGKVYFDLDVLTAWARLTDKEMGQLSNTPQRIVIGASAGRGDGEGGDLLSRGSRNSA